MPSLALVGIQRWPRWLPPVPVPLFLLWPFVPICFGLARLLEKERPEDAAKLRAAMHVFRELRGLSVHVDAADGKRVRIRFV
jgi:hypothetical protein